MTRLIVPLTLALATGCMSGDYDISLDGNAAPTESVRSDRLRIDIHPDVNAVANADGVADILPQTFLIEPSQRDLDLILHPAVTLEGIVTGWKTTPFDTPGLPGQLVPVGARLQLTQENTTHGRVGTSSPDDGSYALRAVPGQSYLLHVLPDDADLPFGTVPLHLSEDQLLDVDLGAGASIWGTVTADGVPLAEARVRAEVRGGTVGEPILADAQGRFLLRVPPDEEVRLISLGRDNGQLDPTVTTDWFYVDAVGTRRDITYAPLGDLPVVSGRVTAGGVAFVDAQVVLTSSLLDGFAESATASRTDETSAGGLFAARVVPGRYQARIDVPRPNQQYASYYLGVIDASTSVDLGTIDLLPFVPRGGVIVDPLGNSVANALIQFEEVGFGGRTWSTTTDDLGNWSLMLPDSNLHYTLTPPSDRTDLALTTATDTELEVLTFTPGVELAGIATWASADGDVPLALATVEVFDANGVLWAHGLTDFDGQFRVRIAEAVVAQD